MSNRVFIYHVVSGSIDSLSLWQLARNFKRDPTETVAFCYRYSARQSALLFGFFFSIFLWIFIIKYFDFWFLKDFKNIFLNVLSLWPGLSYKNRLLRQYVTIICFVPDNLPGQLTIGQLARWTGYSSSERGSPGCNFCALFVSVLAVQTQKNTVKNENFLLETEKQDWKWFQSLPASLIYVYQNNNKNKNSNKAETKPY
jgi:hypothetical protein